MLCAALSDSDGSKVGHEIIGRAVRVGKNAEGNIKAGDRVGVGAQSSSCLRPDCEECSGGLENHCRNPGNASTFDSRYPDGSKATGGYAEYARVPSHFVIKIPDGLPSAEAAPMLCGGVTVYTPLAENGAGPGTRVGVIGTISLYDCMGPPPDQGQALVDLGTLHCCSQRYASVRLVMKLTAKQGPWLHRHHSHFPEI